MSDKPVILTGLRANEDLHIGNYFGALLPLIDQVKQNKGKYQINLFVPDLHSITTEIDYKTLQNNIKNNLKLFVAAGLPLSDKDIKLYRQSYIPAHSELTVILNNFTGVGEMGRMTQYKDKKSKLGNDRVSVGLFDYPPMMAADILLYQAKYVPVGDDQTQHLEFTRDIAERMNKKFGGLFILPEPVQKQHQFFGKDQGLRIKDLMEPGKKMSKSDETGKGVVFLNDKPEEAAKKIMSAETDSLGQIKYNPETQLGVSNLLLIYGLLSGKSADEASHEFAGQHQYGPFKQKVAKKLAMFLEELQQNLADTSFDTINKKLTESEHEMSQVANKTLLRVQKAVGLR